MSQVNDAGVDLKKRRFLTAATGVVGGAGAAMAAVPFLASLAPSERAKAAGAPVKADIAALEDGARMTVVWRGSPVWIVKRTQPMLASLDKVASKLSDPESAKAQQPDYIEGAARALKDATLVMIGRCTHLGCSPLFRPDPASADVPGDWQGGFFCPCHGSKFDLSGRVYKGVPAPLNMPVPPHRYESDTVIVVGEDPVEA